MQTVSTPDGQVYQFPDTMSREQMAAAIQARLAKAKQPQGPETGSASGDFRAGMLQAQMVIPGVRANKHLDIMQNAQTGNLSQGNFAQNAQYLLDLAKSYEADLNLLEDPDERATLADQIADLRNQAANIQSTAATPTAQNTQASLDAAAGRSAQTLATDVLPNLMDLQRRSSQIPMSAKAQEMFNPEGDTFLQQTGDVFDTFREAPGEITRTVFLRSLPAMIPTVAAAIAGTAVGGPAAGGTLAGLVGGSTELGIALSQELTQELGSRGVNVEDPNAVKAWSEANPELITDMLMNARKRALAIGTVDAITGRLTGRIARAANQGGKVRKGAGLIAGGTVGAVGEGLGESAALQAEGKEQNPGELFAEVFGAGPMIAGQTAGQMAVQKSRSLYTSDGTLADPTTLEESYRGAAGDVARQLQELAKANGYNLKDIDNSSEGGAKQALEDLRQGNNETITGLVAVLKPLLSPKNAKSLEDLLLNYTQASAGIKGAKKKVSSRVTQDQLDAARRLVGGLKEGQELLNALQKSNVITDLFKRGVQGGVSRFTDLFNPISMAGAGYNAPKIAANAMLGSGLPMITQGGTIPAQGALWVMGRLTDAMTGRRSKVARFVRQNTGKFGLPTPEGPSIIAAEQLKEKKAAASKNQAKAIRASLAQFNTKMNVADFEQSPIGNFLFRTGLDKQGLIDVVSMMSKDPDIANDPGMLALIDQINENLAGGENQIEALSDAILAVGAYAQENAPHLIKFQPDSPSLLRSFDPSASPEVSSGAPQQTTGPQQSGRQFTSPENYQAGEDANIEVADTLQSTLSADLDVSVTDKGQLLSVLGRAKKRSPDIVAQLQTDIEALQRNEVSSEAIDKYVRPYLDRVTNQREQKSRLQRLQDAPKKPTSTQTEAPAPTEAMTEAPVVPQTAGEMVAEGSIIEGAVRAISEGTMAPESVDAMLSSLEASTPGIRAKIEAIVNRQPPEAPAAPALAETPALPPEAPAAPALTEAPAAPALSPDNYSQALNLLAEEGKVSISWLQRKLGMPYSEAETLVNRMEAEGYISAPNHVGKREALVRPPRQQDDRDLEVDQSSPVLLSTSEAGRKVKDQVIEGSLLYGKLSGNKDHIAFESVSNLSSDLADAVKESIDELNIRNIEVRTDISNVSPSSYVQVQILDEASWDPEYKEYLDIEDEFKLRFSDHPDYQQYLASDKTIRFDQSKTLEHLEDIEGYYGSRIDFLEFKSLVQEGVDTVLSKVDAETTAPPALLQQDSRDLEVDQSSPARPALLSDPTLLQRDDLDYFDTPLPLEGKPTVRKIGEAMNADHQKKYGRQIFPENSEDDYQQVLGRASEELKAQLEQPNSGVGWYSKDVEDAMAMASRVYPSLATEQTHRQLYLTFAGIFSNGADPDNAFMMSSWAFEDFLRTGEVPVNRAEGFRQQGLEPPKTTFKSAKTGKMVTKDAGWGIRNKANEQQLGMLKYLVETKGGLAPAMDFLLQPQTREDINNVMLDSGLYKAGRYTTKAEKAGAPEYGFLAFGKKLGRYSMGLHGVEIDAGDSVIDLWYTRSYRRWTGRLLETPVAKEGVAGGPANDAERNAVFRLTGDLSDQNSLDPGDTQAVLWFFEKRLWGSQGLRTKEGTNSSGARKLLKEKGIPLNDDGEGSDGSNIEPSRSDVGAGQTADDREAPALSDFIRNGSSQLRRAFSRRVPSKQEVVGQFPAVKALFEIGKKGSPYENGITNIEDALTLAKALGITVHMFNDHQKMLETLGSNAKTLRGRFTKTSNGASGHVFALEPGTNFLGTDSIGSGRNLTDIEALTTLLHEIFHGVTMAPMSGVGPMLNGNGNGTPSVENAIGAMIDKPQGKRTPQERKILREITRLQNSLSAYVEGKPTERRPVRGLMAAMDKFDQRRNQMTPEEQMDFENKLDAHVKYIRSKGEFSVDPFWVYAVNPKMAKLVMPETAKWIRGELRKAGNKDIQFFTHPLAISIAVVMALMASEQAEDEQEEQQRQQMQPGALSPNAGMLSAA
jgi:DNA-binding MarR family transcriptional regulator